MVVGVGGGGGEMLTIFDINLDCLIVIQVVFQS